MPPQAPPPRPSAPPQVVFEHPLNERIRTFLRLEHLFEKIEYFMPQYDSWATRVAIEALIDLAAVTARADLKSEIAKEMERSEAALSRLADQPGVDPGALDQVLAEIGGASAGLQAMTAPIGQSAREDDLLKGIAQRSTIPGGTLSFDLPQYHYLLIQSPDRRQARLDAWSADLKPAERAVRLILGLVRDSARPRLATAEGGFYQEALDPQAPAQLLRVGIEAGRALYPEVSGHKGRFSIRFMSTESRGRPTPIGEDLAFRLTCCGF